MQLHTFELIYAENVSSLNDKFVCYLSCGDNHAAAITTNGKLFTWGSNQFGKTMSYLFCEFSKGNWRCTTPEALSHK
jgi:alpha-tubulin suppressor-like RCC1 family protein